MGDAQPRARRPIRPAVVRCGAPQRVRGGTDTSSVSSLPKLAARRPKGEFMRGACAPPSPLATPTSEPASKCERQGKRGAGGGRRGCTNPSSRDLPSAPRLEPRRLGQWVFSPQAVRQPRRHLARNTATRWGATISRRLARDCVLTPARSGPSSVRIALKSCPGQRTRGQRQPLLSLSLD